MRYPGIGEDHMIDRFIFSWTLGAWCIMVKPFLYDEEIALMEFSPSQFPCKALASIVAFNFPKPMIPRHHDYVTAALNSVQLLHFNPSHIAIILAQNITSSMRRMWRQCPKSSVLQIPTDKSELTSNNREVFTLKTTIDL